MIFFAFHEFRDRSVSQAIIRCCSHPLKSTVEQQLEDVEPDVSEEKAKSLLAIGKTITYENYIPLWKSIMSVTSLKVRSLRSLSPLKNRC